MPPTRGRVAEEGRGGAALWWAALQQVEGLGASALLRLARTFGSPDRVLQAAREDLIARGRLSQAQADRVAALQESLPTLQGRIASWRNHSIDLIELGDDRYPGGLADLRAAPPLLYVRGAPMPRDARAVAVVGTREPDRPGVRSARILAREFARRGFTIVSGLARGIDTAGHRGALAVEQGRTIAVLGCGLLRVYPPENAVLAQQIARRGYVAAEVPPDREVDRRLLLARDRLQAALSRAVIVIQAHAECGSIVTARHAAGLGRLLFAVPWEEPPFSLGWRRLEALGAKPIGPEHDLDAVAREIDAPPAASRQEPLP